LPIMQRMRKSQAKGGADRPQMVSNYSTVTDFILQRGLSVF
jgi:hypothetical protein